MIKIWNRLCLIVLLIGLAACQPSDIPAEDEPPAVNDPLLNLPVPVPFLIAKEPDPPLFLVTPTVASVATVPPYMTPTATPPRQSPLPLPVLQEAAPPPQPTATPEPILAAEMGVPVVEPVDGYKVHSVASNDVLNVRSGPGVGYPVVSDLAPDATEIQVSGPGTWIGYDLWVPVSSEQGAGWVNSHYLTEMSNNEQLCQNDAVQALLQQLHRAVAGRDGKELAKLTSEYGLGWRLSWWNPEVRFDYSTVQKVFDSQERLSWGFASRSGQELIGSFTESLLPLLEEDLLRAIDVSCDELLIGPINEQIELPAEYAERPFVVLHRPAPRFGDPYDWGSWVVGIVEVNERFFIDYLLYVAPEKANES